MGRTSAGGWHFGEAPNLACMDRAAISQLFDFTEYGWQKYEVTIRPLGDQVLTTPAPGSGWPSLRDALAHINWAYVRWLADPVRTTSAKVERVTSWHELDDYRRRVRTQARAYMDSLSDDELTAPRAMNVDGDMLTYSPADILTHVLLHERQHHGDLNTLLYQLGVEIPVGSTASPWPRRAKDRPH
jgi:uncharacterized damage-inducible protein DinB